MQLRMRAIQAQDTSEKLMGTYRIPYLDAIRTVAVFMVVAIHTMGYVPIEGAQHAIISFLVHTVAVPVFFLVDGIIFAKTSHERGL